MFWSHVENNLKTILIIQIYVKTVKIYDTS